MRRLQFALFFVTLLAGTFGWAEWLATTPASGEGYPAQQWIDAIYRAIQLFLGNLDRPNDVAPQLPLALQMARFAAPLVTVWAVIELITGELSVWPGVIWARLRRSDEYAVVGFGGVGQAIAESLTRQPRARGGAGSRRIVVLDRHLDAAKQRLARSIGTQIWGRDVLLLTARGRWVTGLGRAKRIYIAAGSDAENLAIAAVLVPALGARARDLWVHIDDYALLERLRDIDPAEHQAGSILPRYFCLREAAVEKLLIEDAPVTDIRPPLRRMHLGVVGIDQFTRLLVENAALYGGLGAPSFQKPKVTLIATDAATAVVELKARHPAIGEWIDVDALEASPKALCWVDHEPRFAQFEAPDAVSHWIFAEHHLPQALALYRGMTTEKRTAARITVASGFDASQAQVAGAVTSSQRAGVGFYGALREAAPWSIALNEELEAVARGFHDKWSGTGDPTYDELPETMRISNWRAALHALLKLRYLGFGGLDPCAPAFGLADADFNRLEAMLDQPDLLAGLGQFEYIRWCVDRVLDGWTAAATRDDIRRTRPQLEHGRGNYHRLNPDEVEKDRNQIASLVETLRAASKRGRRH